MKVISGTRRNQIICSGSLLCKLFRDVPLEEKLWGGGGGNGTKYKKKIRAIPALAFHTFCTNFKKAGRKAYCVQNIGPLNKLPAEFWSC